MLSVSVRPASRFAWPGSRLTFRIKAQGADSVVLARPVGPDVHCSVASAPVDGGCEAVLDVRVGSSAGFG